MTTEQNSAFYIIPEDGSCQVCQALGRICRKSNDWLESEECVACAGTGRANKIPYTVPPRHIET